MKRNFLVSLSLLLLVACGGDEGESSSGLQCDTYAWCTSYGATSASPSNVPPLEGGTLVDGIYRAQEGTFSAEAFVIEGNTIVFIGDGYQNQQGTWSVEGGLLTVALESECDFRGTRDQVNEWTFLFAVDGNSVYWDSQGCFGDCEPERYERVSSLCSTDEFFDCGVTNCQCVQKVGQGLPEQSDDSTWWCQTE